MPPTNTPDHATARRKATRLLARPHTKPGLKALANAYMWMADKHSAFIGALGLVFQGDDYTSDVHAAALKVQNERAELAELRAALRAAKVPADFDHVVASLAPHVSKVLPDLDYADLSGGIRDTVRKLRSWGYETTDSGDGTNFDEGMECALDSPMVSITVDSAAEMVAGVRDIFERFRALGVDMHDPEYGVQGTVGGGDMAFTIQVYGISDIILEGADAPSLVN